VNATHHEWRYGARVGIYHRANGIKNLGSVDLVSGIQTIALEIQSEAGKRVAKKLGVTAASNKSHDGLGRVDAFFVIFE